MEPADAAASHPGLQQVRSLIMIQIDQSACCFRTEWTLSRRALGQQSGLISFWGWLQSDCRASLA
jgi:hypothetical protein